MTLRLSKLNRGGISLTEILIGIMVLGIGVISLATLFPIGLLRVRRAVNDVRGTVEGRSAWSEVRVRNLLAPPLGPWYANPNTQQTYFVKIYTPFSADVGGLHTRFADSVNDPPFRPVTGAGIPVVIDPLWVLSNPGATAPIQYRLGVVDLDQSGAAGSGKLDFIGGEGLFRTQGGVQLMSLGSEIFSSADDVTFGDVENRRMAPYQGPNQIIGSPTPPPPYLTPSYGVPFYDATGLSLLRERRYTWLVIARKTSAAQVYSAGSNGAVGTGLGLADVDDLLDNHGPDAGADGVLGPNYNSVPPAYDDPTYDDPARDMATALPVPAPIGPFDVTIVVFYNRDFTSREVTYSNYLDLNQMQPIVARPTAIFCPVPRTITIGGTTYGPFDANEATLVKRIDGIPFPEIPTGGFILDATFDGSTQNGIGPRGGHVYRVEKKSLNSDGNILVLSLDRAARPNGPLPAALPLFVAPDVASGYVLTYLKSAVSVFEKQVP